MTDTNNPLMTEWTTPHAVPPFSMIKPEHFEEAIEHAFEGNLKAIAAIINIPGEPTFSNTVEALEKSETQLIRTARVFFNLTGAHTNEALQQVERTLAPKFAVHEQTVLLNQDLFARVDQLMSNSDNLDLTPEQARVLTRLHANFVRAGARLSEPDRARMTEISSRLATIGTEFSQNILTAENAYKLVLENADDLKGLPESLIKSAAQTAEDLGHPGAHVITLSRSSIEPFLQYSDRRDLREQAFNAWTSRGRAEGGPDNRPLAAETIRLRNEKALLLGFENFAAFRLDDSMAKTPENVRDLLNKVWPRALLKAHEEAEKLSQLAQNEGANIKLAPWDWRYYSEKQRKAEFDIDEADAKPYLGLENMIEAVFDTAHRLFGLSINERTDIPVYHPDVRAFEVLDRDGKHIALFLADYFARPSKRSGAWMSAYRGQEKLGGDIRPVIVNVLNFIPGGKGEPTLLTLDDARTLFHEFGHALHGMLSNVTYQSVSGTSVARDFVELPSQLFEHWLTEPEVLKRFAVHYQTGEPIPDALLEKLLKSRKWGQGFASVEYTAAAMVDIELHSVPDPENLDVMQFEADVLKKLNMPDAITVRHSAPHFAHIFSGDGYSSAYYSYLWSEVMDADAFRAFEEAGDPFDPATARLLHDNILTVGNSVPPEDAYIAFRGRLPEIDAMLEKKGLA